MAVLPTGVPGLERPDHSNRLAVGLGGKTDPDLLVGHTGSKPVENAPYGDAQAPDVWLSLAVIILVRAIKMSLIPRSVSPSLSARFVLLHRLALRCSLIGDLY